MDLSRRELLASAIALPVAGIIGQHAVAGLNDPPRFRYHSIESLLPGDFKNVETDEYNVRFVDDALTVDVWKTLQSHIESEFLSGIELGSSLLRQEWRRPCDYQCAISTSRPAKSLGICISLVEDILGYILIESICEQSVIGKHLGEKFMEYIIRKPRDLPMQFNAVCDIVCVSKTAKVDGVYYDFMVVYRMF